MIYDRFTKDLFPFLPLHGSAPSVTFRGDKGLFFSQLIKYFFSFFLALSKVDKYIVLGQVCLVIT